MKVVFSLIIAALMITACSEQVSSPQATPVLPVETAAPTSPPPLSEQVDPTEEPVALPPTDAIAEPASGSLVTYQIVPGESQVTYEVGEVFINQNNRFNVAQGITPQVTGEISVDFENPQASSIGPIEVDISQFTSDSSRRDNAIRGRFLESARFPIATFKPTAVDGLPGSYQEGEPVSFQVSGDLTVREVTRPMTFDVTAVARSDSLEGNATTTLLMSDFAVGPISIGGILNTEDEVKLNFQFVARPSQ
jgi:polyisoprenoid-binding protein YceI